MFDMMQQDWGPVWQYIVLFVLAAAPWLEVFLVVPLGIAWGLHPIGVAVTGFVGNLIPILLIGFFFKQFRAWRARRKARKAQTEGSPDTAEIINPASKKHRRARQIWEKYGVPGLALLAPAIVGTDIAAVLALSFGSSRRWVMSWMIVSLALWTIFLTVGSVYGLEYIAWFKSKT